MTTHEIDTGAAVALSDDVGPGGERTVAPILRADGTLAPGASCPMDEQTLLEALEMMIRSRLLDQRGISFQRQGRVGVFGETRGQEASTVGSALAVDPGTDWVVPAYRDLPAVLRQGVRLTQFWLTCIGHPAGWDIPETANVFPSQIELGAQLPHAVGLAWGLRHQRLPGAVLTYFGDGASSEGDFYEAGNLAGVLDAPVVMFCQNNGWAISTPRHRQTRAASIAAKAAGFGIPGYVVDGNDVMAVYAITRQAMARAQAGGGPTLIEAQTYRLGGHNTADDPTRYTGPADAEGWLSLDPVERLQTYLRAQDLWDDEREAALREHLLTAIDESFAQAEQIARDREPEMLFDNVYASSPRRFERQRSAIRAAVQGEQS